MNFKESINLNLAAPQKAKHFYYSWILIFTSSLFLTYKYVLETSPSVITHELMNVYYLSGTSFGLLAGFYFYSYMLMQIPAGLLLDKCSIKKVTILAIAVCTLGAYLFYVTTSYEIACFARVLIGLGSAFATVSYMKLASLWFDAKRFSLLSGLFGTACMGGAGIAQLMNAWFARSYGWKAMLLYSSAMGLLLLFLFMSVVKEKIELKVSSYSIGIKNALKETFFNKYNYPLIFYNGLSFTPVAVFAGLWGIPYLEQAYRLSRSAAAISTSLVFFGFALGGPIFGLLSNKLKKRKMFIIYGTTASLVFFSIVIYFPHLSYELINVSLFLFGFFNSVFLISYTMAKEINALAITATVIAVINMGDAIFGAITDPIIGRLLDLGWSGKLVNHERIFSTADFQFALSVLTLYLLVSIIFAFFSREPIY